VQFDGAQKQAVQEQAFSVVFFMILIICFSKGSPAAKKPDTEF